MVDAAIGALSSPERHVERIGDELGAAVIAETPAEHPAAPRIQDEGPVDPAVVGAVLGDVGHPELVGAVDRELAIDEIISRRVEGVAFRAAPPTPSGDAFEAGVAHEPLDALAAAADAHADGELGVNSRAAVGAP